MTVEEMIIFIFFNLLNFIIRIFNEYSKILFRILMYTTLIDLNNSIFKEN